MDSKRRDEVEAWWALISRVLAFFLGSAILIRVALFGVPVGVAGDTYATLGLFALCAALMGPLVAASVAGMISAYRGGSDG